LVILLFPPPCYPRRNAFQKLIFLYLFLLNILKNLIFKGTSFGNIYTIWASPSTSNFSFNFQNTALSKYFFTFFFNFQELIFLRVEELKTQQNRSITDICINSLNENKIVLLFNNFVIIVFDNAKNVVLNKIVVSCAITVIF